MARTQNDIYTALLTQKALDSNLDVLSSSSAVAIWRLWLKIVAYGQWLHETLWDVAKADIDARAAKAIPGTPAWYIKTIKAFQLGDILQVDPDTLVPYYPEIDPIKQIVTHVALRPANGGLLIKVAKDTAGDSQPLTSTELSELSGYIYQVKFAGTRFALLSDHADVVKAHGTIYYDPQYDLSSLMDAADQSVEAYLSNLPFDGLFRSSAYADALKGTAGIVDVAIDLLQCKPNGGSYTDLFSNDGMGNISVKAISYQPSSGYFITDAIVGEAFNFVPYVSN